MKPAFTLITLGTDGGLNEGNLPSHLLAPIGSTDFVCLDAGVLMDGIRACAKTGCFDDITPVEGLTLEGTVLNNNIKAYLITHPYLDHNQGIASASPYDTKKPIISLSSVIDDLRDHLYNWRIWPNFSDEGEPPALGIYSYVRLVEGQRMNIEGTSMSVVAHPLSHGEHTDSAAFLIECDGRQIVYMGDTGPDEVEGCNLTEDLFQHLAPMIKTGTLHAIMLETSFVNERPDDQLFSHLTPRWVMKALRRLAGFVDESDIQRALKGLNIIVTHIKPDHKSGPTPREKVIKQYGELNDLGVNFIFIEQGKKYEF
jgi:3',5'-cyclic-nucleotide phosphodiesterase